MNTMYTVLYDCGAALRQELMATLVQLQVDVSCAHERHVELP